MRSRVTRSGYANTFDATVIAEIRRLPHCETRCSLMRAAMRNRNCKLASHDCMRGVRASRQHRDTANIVR
jgi:hypothetical protein